MNKLQLLQLLQQYNQATGLKRKVLELKIIDSGLIKIIGA